MGAAYAVSHPGAVASVAVSGDLAKGIKASLLDAYRPDDADAHSAGKYPLSRSLFLNIPNERGAWERVRPVLEVAYSAEGQAALHKVGRCRLTVSNPALKAPLVSALETIVS